MLAVESCSALVLNADYRPLSTFPLARFSWRKSIEELMAGKIDVVSEYDRFVRSEKLTIPVPSVVALRKYVDLNRPAPLTRIGVFTRDRFRCAFCGGRFSSQDLTFDHLVPRSKAGRTSWLNILTACGPCNLAKGNRSLKQLGWELRYEPYHPTIAQLNAIGATLILPTEVETSWRDYLYWTVPLEP